jgi:hypothetical protein
MAETVSELRHELNQARADLQQTSSEIKRRLAYDELRLERQVKDNPVASVLIGAGLGFVIGRASRHTAVLLALLTGAAIGYSLASGASGQSGQAE